ncbi:OLC1v1000255C1 [Oldenlandia corymbosa var. corymbosa]|uniref:OLC1v1000255C1 n=1 Tax=Oldenlandia corymbosa var. corymbosa TaxID=529605 RepID=A0AAV1D5F3_OLDCO|nr:OLC1v1000255C1 [Oldenlandia corymbosa var. corymbosa]
MEFVTKKYYFVTNLVLLFLFSIAIIPLYSGLPPGIFSSPFNAFFKGNQSNVNVTGYQDELEEALSKASTKDNTVIITVANKAYVEPHNDQYPTMFDIFLEGFWVGEKIRNLLDHLLVVSMDQTAYDRCLFNRLNCYRLVTEGVDFAEEKLYMSEGFIKMMWARTGLLVDVLKRGYNFIFTDMDIIWLRDPFPILLGPEGVMLNETDDLQISTDRFNNDPRSIDNAINTGFYHIRSNNKTITLLETWYDRRRISNTTKEQDALRRLIWEGIIRRLGLKVRFLDTLYFSGFCQNSRDVKSVVTVHSNCCWSIGAKVSDLAIVLRDWRMSMKFRDPAANSSEFQWSPHDFCRKAREKPPQV